MPKEVVYGETLAFDGPSDEPSQNEQPVVEVRWSREAGDMQIVTKIQGYEFAGPDEELTYHYGMFVNLDRRGINDLIRYLRRARDQAFGKDE